MLRDRFELACRQSPSDVQLVVHGSATIKYESRTVYEEERAWKVLRHAVSTLLFGSDCNQLYLATFVQASDEVAVDFNMLVPSGDDWILNHENTGTVVLVHWRGCGLYLSQF